MNDARVLNFFKFRVMVLILSITLIVFGLFLPWSTVGDLISMNKPPLAFHLRTTFAEGGSFSLPSLEQTIPLGFFLLLSAGTLIVLVIGRLSSQLVKWTTFGTSLLYLTVSSYYLVVIWKLYLLGGKVGLYPPRIGLYVFLLGSIILFLYSLNLDRTNAKDKR